MPTNCSCKTTTDPVISVCLFCPCISCQTGYWHCTFSPCFCTNGSVPSVPCSCTDHDSGIRHTCIHISPTRNYRPGIPSPTSTNFTLDQSMTVDSNDCSNGQNTKGFVLVLQPTGRPRKRNCFICMYVATMLSCVLKRLIGSQAL